MPVTILGYTAIKATLVAAVRAKLQAALPGGTPIPPTFAMGDPLDALTDAQAIDSIQFQSQLDYVQRATTPSTASGQDLINLVSLYYTAPTPAQATKPVLFGQNVVGTDTETVSVGLTVWGKDKTGALSIGYTTIQDPTQQPGVAGLKPSGVGAAWALAQAILPGSNANLPANSFGPGSLGGSLPWADYVADPPVATPNAPALSGAGSTGGSTTYQYQVVAKGVPVTSVAGVAYGSGVTQPSATGQTTTGLATLTGTNKITVTWTMPTAGDGPLTASASGGFDVLKNTGTIAVPVWSLLGSTAAGVMTLDDTGQATSAYVYPTVNTTNAGVGGVDQLTDAQIRTNASNVLTANAQATGPAILDQVLAVPGVAKAFLQDAGQNGQAAGTFQLQFLPTAVPATPALTAAVQTAVNTAQGEGIIGTAVALTPVNVNIAYTFSVASGTTGSSAVPATDAAISAYFAGLNVGDAVRASGIVAALMAVSGLVAVTAMTLTRTSDSSVYSNFADVPGVVGQVYAAGSRTPTTS